MSFYGRIYVNIPNFIYANINSIINIYAAKIKKNEQTIIEEMVLENLLLRYIYAGYEKYAIIAAKNSGVIYGHITKLDNNAININKKNCALYANFM